MARLFVNLDHVATLRQARGTPYPDLAEAARQAEASGYVHGITLHLREDRRHVQDDDMRKVRQLLRLPFNFEMSTAAEIVAICRDTHPAQATLVPERREELTTEGGLDLESGGQRVREVVRQLQSDGIVVSLFIDPSEASVRRAADTGATHVELHTGRYADAKTPAEREKEHVALTVTAALARSLGLKINAGHGLTAQNVGPVAAIPGMLDLNIGHAIVSRAVFVGLNAALREVAHAMAHGGVRAAGVP